MQERGLVYCDGGDCILVPTVCRNVSRIARARVANERAEGDGPPVAVVPPLPDEVVPGELTADLPSGLAGVGGKPVLGELSGGEDGSFAAGAAIDGPGGFLSMTTGRAGSPSRVDSSGANAAGAVSGPELPAAVAAVPEPETWCLLMGGLVALGAASRRRRPRTS